MFKLLKASNRDAELNPQNIEKAYQYIVDYWPVLTRYHPQTTDTIFGLPNPYIVPADQHGNFRFNEQYYWDSYFTSIGLIASGQNQLAEGMLENLFYMFGHFKMIPSASRLYMTSRSQPPILTSYIMLIYHANNKTKDWLKEVMAIAQEEYLNVWMSEVHPHWRQVHRGLSRYYDINVLHDLAEAESGWDMTPRFDRKALDFLPVDLNSLLYKYEIDFSAACAILNDHLGQEMWLERASARKSMIDELMWGKTRHFYFDYNFNKKSRGPIWSLASYYTMWAGLASQEQAGYLVKHLSKFNCEGGLSATSKTIIDMSIFGSLKTQWAHPNGWAPLHYIVIEGLKRYGYTAEADKIAKKWLATNMRWFNHHGEFLEKYNVSEPAKKPLSGVYPTQAGFGWTNAIFVHLAKEQNLIRRA